MTSSRGILSLQSILTYTTATTTTTTSNTNSTSNITTTTTTTTRINLRKIYYIELIFIKRSKNITLTN